MGVTIGFAAMQIAQKQDAHRITQSNRNTNASKKSRIVPRVERALEDESYEECEGILYAAGIAD